MYFVFHCHLRFRGLKKANDNNYDKSNLKHVKLCAILFLHVQILFLALQLVLFNFPTICPN